MSRKRFGWRRLGVLILIAGALVVAGASPASAHDDDDDYYTVDIDGTVGGTLDTNAGDANAVISVKITNLASQKLGSANVTVPSPFAALSTNTGTLAGQVLQLRNLNLSKNASKTVTLTVDVRTCAPATPAAFGIVAKKTSDFSGSNAFTLKSPSDKQVNVVGKCSLAFLAQPLDGERNVAITSVGGAPISVRVLDAGGADVATSFAGTITLTAANPTVPAPIAIGGTSSAPASGGIATFAPTLSVSAFDYTFTASSPGLAPSSPSSKFAIADDKVTCAAGQACAGAATTTNGGVTATATFSTPGASNTSLSVSINAADAPTFECNGYPRGSSKVSQFGFSGDAGKDRTGTFSVTIPNASWLVILYQVCWASPVDFYTKFGKLASQGAPDVGDGIAKPGTTTGETLKVGLLPNCKKWWWNDHWDWDEHWDFPNPTIETLPCITSRTYNWSTKSVTIEVKTTGADPWRY